MYGASKMKNEYIWLKIGTEISSDRNILFLNISGFDSKIEFSFARLGELELVKQQLLNAYKDVQYLIELKTLQEANSKNKEMIKRLQEVNNV
jgi:hypothetical protein